MTDFRAPKLSVGILGIREHELPYHSKEADSSSYFVVVNVKTVFSSVCVQFTIFRLIMIVYNLFNFRIVFKLIGENLKPLLRPNVTRKVSHSGIIRRTD